MGLGDYFREKVQPHQIVGLEPTSSVAHHTLRGSGLRLDPMERKQIKVLRQRQLPFPTEHLNQRLSRAMV